MSNQNLSNRSILKATLFILMISVVGLIPFVGTELVEAAAPQLPDLENAMKQQILSATIRIELVDISMYLKDQDNIVEGQESNLKYIQTTNQTEGLGTMVLIGSDRFIVTHNHWSLLRKGDEKPDIVKFYSADKKPYLEITGDEFMKLIVYRDSGTLIFKVPPKIEIKSHVSFKENLSLRPGELVYLLHKGPAADGEIVFIPAELTSVNLSGDVPSITLKSLSGEVIMIGDSGGGIWFDGELIGNMWGSIEVTSHSRLPWVAPKSRYVDRSIGALMTSRIQKAANLNLLRG